MNLPACAHCPAKRRRRGMCSILIVSLSSKHIRVVCCFKANGRGEQNSSGAYYIILIEEEIAELNN
jgi:hypothetical protein